MVSYQLKLLCDAMGRLYVKTSAEIDLSFFAFGNLQRKLPIQHDNLTVNDCCLHIRPVYCIHQLDKATSVL